MADQLSPTRLVIRCAKGEADNACNLVTTLACKYVSNADTRKTKWQNSNPRLDIKNSGKKRDLSGDLNLNTPGIVPNINASRLIDMPVFLLRVRLRSVLFLLFGLPFPATPSAMLDSHDLAAGSGYRVSAGRRAAWHIISTIARELCVIHDLLFPAAPCI